MTIKNKMLVEETYKKMRPLGYSQAKIQSIVSCYFENLAYALGTMQTVTLPIGHLKLKVSKTKRKKVVEKPIEGSFVLGIKGKAVLIPCIRNYYYVHDDWTLEPKVK